MHVMASNCLSLWLGRATEWAKLNTRLHSGAAPLAAPRAVRCRVAWGCRVLWWRDLLLWKAYRGVNRISSIIDAAFLSNAGRGAYTTKPRVRRPAGSGTSPLALADAAQETGPKHEVEHTNPSCYWHHKECVIHNAAQRRRAICLHHKRNSFGQEGHAVPRRAAGLQCDCYVEAVVHWFRRCLDCCVVPAK